MALTLNTTKEAYKSFPEKGTASNTEQMPKLIADNRVPMNVAVLMQRRLDVRNAEKNVKSSWMDNYFDTGDAIVYHSDGRVKIVLDSQHLREINPKSALNNGALILTEDIYNALQGEEFKKDKLGKTGSPLSKTDVKAHPIWKVLARDQALLNDYVDYIFAKGKQRFNYDNAMGIYTSSAGGDVPEMRAWYVDRLEYRSSADGWYDLDDGSGRLVGLAPEALGALGKGAENIRTYTMADILTAKEQLDFVEKTIRPELTKDIRSLVSKL